MTKALLLIFNEKAYLFRVGGKEVWRKTKENEIHFIEPRFYYLETVLIGQPHFKYSWSSVKNTSSSSVYRGGGGKADGGV